MAPFFLCQIGKQKMNEKPREEIIEKIQKLLALSKSDNPNEAANAMERARKLMAVHKIQMQEMNVKKSSVIQESTEFTYTNRSNAYVGRLADVIAEEYCCICWYESEGYRSQKLHNFFMGYEEDVKVCTHVYNFALEVVEKEIRELKRQLKKEGYPGTYITRACKNFGYGFADGLKETFLAGHQSDPSEWGLVMVVPDEARIFERENLSYSSYTHSYNPDMDYRSGMESGRRFDPHGNVTGGSNHQIGLSE